MSEKGAKARRRALELVEGFTKSLDEFEQLAELSLEIRDALDVVRDCAGDLAASIAVLLEKLETLEPKREQPAEPAALIVELGPEPLN